MRHDSFIEILYWKHHMWHDSLHICDMTHFMCDMTHFICVTWLSSYVWHGSLHMCDMTHSHAQHVFRITYTLHMCDMSHSWHDSVNMWHDSVNMWHDSLHTLHSWHDSHHMWHDSHHICDMTHFICVTCLIRDMTNSICDMTHFICVTWLIHDMTHSLRDMTHLIYTTWLTSYLWHDSCTRETWHLHNIQIPNDRTHFLARNWGANNQTPATVSTWVHHREVGGWGRDPKKCTGSIWGMGSSTI